MCLDETESGGLKNEGIGIQKRAVKILTLLVRHPVKEGVRGLL